MAKKTLIIEGKDVTALLTQKYKALKKTGWITLLNAPTDKYMEVNIEAIRVLIEDFNYQGVYITVNRPYSELVAEFSKKGLDTSKLKFVDAVSQMYGAKTEETKQCRYVPGPLNIEAIGQAVRDFIPEIKKPQSKIFVFIDSITTVLLYNHLPRTVRFSEFLTKDLRKMQVNGIMVSVAAGMTSERLINEVKEFCDEVIDIGTVDSNGQSSNDQSSSQPEKVEKKKMEKVPAQEKATAPPVQKSKAPPKLLKKPNGVKNGKNRSTKK